MDSVLTGIGLGLGFAIGGALCHKLWTYWLVFLIWRKTHAKETHHPGVCFDPYDDIR